MDKSETDQILEYLKRIDESINGPQHKASLPKDKRPLSGRMDTVERKIDGLDKKVDGLDKKVGGLDRKVDKRFDGVEGSIESTRLQIVDLVTRVHSELTERIVDLEPPVPGNRGGGGRGSGGSGVPLAS